MFMPLVIYSLSTMKWLKKMHMIHFPCPTRFGFHR